MSSSTKQIQELTARVVQLEELVKKLTDPQEEAMDRVVQSTKPKETKIKETKKPKKDGPTLNKDGTPRKKPKMSGYRLFCASTRAEAKEILEKENDAKVSPGMVVAKLGEMWKELDEEERQVWKDDAEEVEKEKQDEEVLDAESDED